MPTSRRNFLQRTAATAAAIALDPLAHAAGASDAPSAAPPSADVRSARPVPLDKVRVTGGPLKHAQDLTAKYLLELEPDRMMAFYRVRAGLAQKAQPYAGWDGGGRNLTGHIAGHHLSAVSLMYRTTGDARFKDRADYLVRELKEVQDKHADGYLVALENGREAFGALSKGDRKSVV